MALDRKFFFGFQTGGEEEFAGGTASGSIVTSPATWSDKEANYCCKLSWKQQLYAPVVSSTLGVWDTLSFHVRFNDVNQATDNDFYRARDDVGVIKWRLRILQNTDGDLQIVDGDNVVQATIPDTFENDKWYRVTVKTAHSGSADHCVWVEPAEQRWSTDPVYTSRRFNSKGGSNNTIKHTWGNPGWQSGTLAFVYIGSAYSFTDTEDSIDTERILGAFVVLGPYNDVFQNSTSRFGNNLTSGRWDNIVDVPVVDGDVAEYEVTSSGSGSVREGGVTADDISGHIGPLGDSRVDGSLLQMMGVFRAKKENTNMAITFYGKYGTATPADVAVDRTQTINFGALTTSFKDFVHFSTVVPSTTAARYAQIGMKAQRTSGFIGTSAQMAMGAVFFLHEEPRLLIVDGKSQLIGA